MSSLPQSHLLVLYEMYSIGSFVIAHYSSLVLYYSVITRMTTLSLPCSWVTWVTIRYPYQSWLVCQDTGSVLDPMLLVATIV